MNGFSLALSIAAGFLLGVVFYGGLWLTIRHLLVTHNPIGVTLGSLLLRMATVLAGLLLVARGDWRNALACFAGLAIGRIAVSRFLRICI